MQKEKWIERFFRFGFISKGVVYCLFGLLALIATVGSTGEKASKNDAVKTIYEQPFGQVILILLIIGISGYVTLRSFQAIKDIDGKGRDFKALIVRAGYGVSALIYFGFAYSAIELLLGKSSEDGESQQLMVSKIFELPAGKWIVAGVGVIVIGSGINQIYKGITGKFMKHISVIRSDFEKLFKHAGIAGYLSRGLVLTILGYLLIHGAITLNPEEGQSTDQAFAFLEHQFGKGLMAVVAAGLIAYGIFMFVKAAYQQFNIKINH